jgi:hypothetical protein
MSLLVSLSAYFFVCRREGTYLNIMTPSLLIGVPAYYLLPLFVIHFEGIDGTPFAFTYVYLTIAVENVLFAYAYLRPRKIIRLPFRYSYAGFSRWSFAFLGLAILMYLPVLLQFPQYILSPRQIYEQTRVGFGVSYYISSTLAYFAVVLIQFSGRSRGIRWGVVLLAAVVLALHGSKGQLLTLVFLIALIEVYVRKRKIGFLTSALVLTGISALVLVLFVTSMVLEGSPLEMLEAISEYSEYTQNAMLVIDSHFPLQYGRLTLEGQIYGRVPRALVPSKPKNFGALYLDDQFFPESLDEEAGSPDFGIGVQYADFGFLAIVYLGLFALLRGYLAQAFVHRLDRTRHPADLWMVVFLANVAVFPIGAVGWLLPEALLVAFFLRFVSSVGAPIVYQERVGSRRAISRQRPSTLDGLNGAQLG